MIENIQIMTSGHKKIQPEINSRKIMGNFLNIWNLNY
jgi:hypothetical protein